MSPIISQISVALVLHLLFLSVAGGDTAYQVIDKAGLPQGLLPQGVTSYNRDLNSGQLTVNFATGSCSFAITTSYGLKYESQLSGTLSENKYAKLKGLKLKLGNSDFQDVVSVERQVLEIKLTTSQFLTVTFPRELFLAVRACG